MGECFNCGEPATGAYTLVFETGVSVRDRLLCPGCRGFFADSDAMEVHQAPVLMRGGEVVEAEEEE